MSQAWFVVAPVGTSQGSFTNPKVPDGSRLAEADTGTPAYNAWTGNGSYGGWQVVMGPFATKAQAQAAHPPAGLSAVLTAAGLAAQVASGSALGSGPTLPGPTISNPLAAIGDFFSRLTNPHTWLRVAEGLVGVAFLIIGLNALLHHPAGKVAKLAAKVRP
jgi:hypothetical protein